MSEKIEAVTCKHCGHGITHFYGRLWHDDGKIFPQYCTNFREPSDQLHEPALETETEKEMSGMSNITDGGSAFPVAEVFDERRGDYSSYAERGMTLRDYFAAKAMEAIISKSPFNAEPQSYEVYQKTAIGAYDYADAMLARQSQGAR